MRSLRLAGIAAALAVASGCWLSADEVGGRLAAESGAPLDTGEPLGDFEIVAVEPAFGSSAGGQLVRVTLTEASAAIQVRIGGALAERVEAQGGVLTVRTPPGTPGLVDVEVEAGALSRTSAGGFRYYPDASSKIGVIGSVSWTSYPGRLVDLATSLPYDPPDAGRAWVRPVAPNNQRYADVVFGGTGAGCARNPNSSWAAGLAFDLFAMNLEGERGTLGLVWTAENDRFEAALQSNQYANNATWDLLPVQGTAWPEMRVEAAAHTPAALLVQAPNFAWTTVPNSVPPSFDIRWDASAPADEIGVWIERYDAGGWITAPSLREVLSCRTEDDGHFQVPGDLFTGWDSGAVMRVYVSRMRHSEARLPHDASQSGIVGASWVVGDVLQSF